MGKKSEGPARSHHIKQAYMYLKRARGAFIVHESREIRFCFLTNLSRSPVSQASASPTDYIVAHGDLRLPTHTAYQQSNDQCWTCKSSLSTNAISPNL